MCNFLSGIIALDPLRMLCTDLLHHEVTVANAGLKPEQYREWEWTKEDCGESLKIRMPPSRTDAELRVWMLAQFPRRAACLLECVRQTVAVGGYLDLRSLTALPDGLVQRFGSKIIR